MTKLLAGLALLLLVCSAADVQGIYKANEVPVTYREGGYSYSPAKSTGDIIFYEFPDPKSLTPTERYMLFGGVKEDGSSVGEWWRNIYNLAASYDKNTGHLPDVLDFEACKKLYYGSITEADVAHIRNPITGNYPRLNARELSPGDLFIHRLTAEEVTAVLGDTSNWPPAATGPVYYVRVYGEKGVIASQILIEGDATKLRPGDLPPNPNRPKLN